jgi:hypothetical protein
VGLDFGYGHAKPPPVAAAGKALLLRGGLVGVAWTRSVDT